MTIRVRANTKRNPKTPTRTPSNIFDFNESPELVPELPSVVPPFDVDPPVEPPDEDPPEFDYPPLTPDPPVSANE